ncbi:MAG: hypothetical protein GYB65_22170 [Chloroflexi bacterium]|nr:hypothetical protein [Chloroflexota bacterium]
MQWRVMLVLGLTMGLLAACGEDDSGADGAGADGESMRGDSLSAWVGEGPPCNYDLSVPYFNFQQTCSEIVFDPESAVDGPVFNLAEAVPALSGIAFGPDGTLYLAYTAAGEIWAMRDENGDRFMDAPVRVAAGLWLPLRITVYDGALYVSSAEGVWRLADADGDGLFAETERALIIDDLPLETGFWPGGIGVGPDERLYLGLGCVTCDDDDPRRGTLLRYALDGSDEQIVATGLYHPADFDWHPETGDLWVVDAGPLPGGEGPLYAALNRVVPGADDVADFGAPDCMPGGEPCAGVEEAALTLPSSSNPAGVVFYDHTAFGAWPGDLLVAQAGSWDLSEPQGYALILLEFDGGALSGVQRTIAPTSVAPAPVESLAEYSLSGRGFFPEHPIDVAISPEGWIYVALQEGGVLRYRPVPEE